MICGVIVGPARFRCAMPVGSKMGFSAWLFLYAEPIVFGHATAKRLLIIEYLKAAFLCSGALRRSTVVPLGKRKAGLGLSKGLPAENDAPIAAAAVVVPALST